MQAKEEVRAILRQEEAGDDERITSLAVLVAVAIEDGRAILKDDDVHPTYARWLELDRKPEPTCNVCFAGGILLGTRQFEVADLLLGEALRPDAFPHHVSDAMNALEYVRQGSYVNAYYYLGLVPQWSDDNDDPETREAKYERRLQWSAELIKRVADHQPPHTMFRGRDDFTAFLDGMDDIVRRLEAFERDWM